MMLLAAACTWSASAFQAGFPSQEPAHGTINEVFRDVSTEMHEVGDRIREFHFAGMRSISDLRLSYEGKLLDQIREAMELERESGGLRASILTNQEGVNLMRTSCQSTESTNFALGQEVISLTGNLTTALEFADHIMEGRASGKFHQTTDLGIITDLHRTRAKLYKDTLRANIWKTFEEASRTHMPEKRRSKVQRRRGAESSLLQVKSGSTLERQSGPEPKPEVIETLRAAVAQLRRSTETSEERLHAEYAEKLRQGSAALEKLKEEQRQLKATNQGLQHLEPRLGRTLEQMTAIRDYYSHQLRSAHIFLQGIDRYPAVGQQLHRQKRSEAPQAHARGGVYLLQTGSTQGVEPQDPHPEGELTQERSAEDQKKAAYQRVTLQAAGLQAQLLQEHSDFDTATVRLERDFFKRLVAEGAKGIHRQKVLDDLLSDIIRVRESSAKTQQQTEEIMEESRLLAADVHRLKVNVTVLREFLKETLKKGKKHEKAIDRSPLEEMAEEEQKAVKEHEHAMRLAEVSNAWVSLTDTTVSDLDPNLMMMQTGAQARPRAYGATPDTEDAPGMPPDTEEEEEEEDEETDDDSVPAGVLFRAEAGDNELEQTQVAEDLSTVNLRAEEQLNALSHSLSELSRMKAQSEASTREAFAKAFQEHHSNRLNITKAAAVFTKKLRSHNDVFKKLDAAKKTATATRDAMLDQDGQLRKFLHTLGHPGLALERVLAEDTVNRAAQLPGNTDASSWVQLYAESRRGDHSHQGTVNRDAQLFGNTDAASWLQVSAGSRRRDHTHQEQSASEQHNDNADGHPSTFERIAHRASDFQKQLADMEMEGNQQLITHRSQYARRLSELEDENNKVEASIEQVQKKIKVVKETNKQLRARSAELLQDKASLLASLTSLQKNLSTVVDFAMSTLKADASGDEEPLSVLKELDHQDEMNQANKDHESRFGEITSASKQDAGTMLFSGGLGTDSLLQVGSQKAANSPNSILAGLEMDVGELGKEFQQKEAAAHQEFEASEKKLLESNAQLLKHRGELVQEATALIAEKKRLQTALNRLVADVEELGNTSRKLSKFVKKVSEKEMPKTSSMEVNTTSNSSAPSLSAHVGKAGTPPTLEAQEVELQQPSEGSGGKPWLTWFSQR